LLAVFGLDAEQSAQEEVVDFDFGVDVGEFAFEAKDETDQTISSAESWVNSGSDT
jgi:hypothetical protein